ncbi:EamA family transporter [Streptomyces pseudovenezuelae]|uniref:Membrane protein n=1 Tax=Streptomyces pseudovenezuelae TaxID=67350 RepID=A0ABT6LNJ0_9ACTN|nr:EamA family transporter [Streptomyces pseudovenezuelae]MDH6217883.1 putative membrane protein [Streptomyces pseudovenezuelae]
MTTALLATVAALGWGAADYCGARASRNVPAHRVVFLSQVLSLPVIAVWLAATTARRPGPGDLIWGLGAGAFGLLGMVLLYRTLASEGIVLVAPVTAVTVALVPLAVGLFIQSAPGLFALCGVFCALASIALVSPVGRIRRDSIASRTLLLALATGGALGLQLVCLSHPGPGAGLWPLAGARVFSILCVAPRALRGRQPTRTARVPWLLVVLAGALDTAAFAFYLFAMDRGLLSVVGPVVSLYPAATVVLALALDGERVTIHQAFGLCLGAGALLLVAL